MILLTTQTGNSLIVKDSENPSGSNGRDAAAAATASSDSSGSEFKALRLCDAEAMPDVVSKCIICIHLLNSEYDKWKPLKGAAIDLQHALDAVEDLKCGTVTTCLPTYIRCSGLKEAFDEVVSDFQTSENLRRAGAIRIRTVHGWVGFRGVLDGNWCGWRWPLGVAILAGRWSVVGVLRWCWWSGFREGYPY